MKNYILMVLLCISSSIAYSQSISFKTIDEAGQILIGVSVQIKETKAGKVSDNNGLVSFTDLSAGSYTFVFKYLGYESVTIKQQLPIQIEMPIIVSLEESHEHEMEAITVKATRTSRLIDNTPTRVEVIAGEELEEKGNMNAANISMILRESTGIQVQQTSATSANATFRIQGLDGRYTQLLRDGIPLYNGFAGGLSIMQIPPLDLQQVEIIKGSSSTLYGGGAIAGLINLVPIKPTDERRLNLMTNFTSAGGQDYNVFYAEKFGKIGTSVYGTLNKQAFYDPDGDRFTNIPEISRWNLNPSIFFYGENDAILEIGGIFSEESRNGGDIRALNETPGFSYVERTKTNRNAAVIQYQRSLNASTNLQIKGNYNYYDRETRLANFQFSGIQKSSFSEINLTKKAKENDEWIGGLNLWTDQFEDRSIPTSINLGYQLTTVGAFLQRTTNINDKNTLESGLRIDHTTDYGTFVLPRVSWLHRFNSRLSTRLGGGLGYKNPTVFTEKSEEINFRYVLPISPEDNAAERSVGANLDVNYLIPIGDEASLSINQLFFYTQINNPLILQPEPDMVFLKYNNVSGDVHTAGFETNIKANYKDFKLFAGYTFINARNHYEGMNTPIPLTPRSQVGVVLMYEIEGKLRAGFESYFTGKQYLMDESYSPSYWRFGFMGEKIWERFSIFINFENFTDTRQDKFSPIVGGSPNEPTFTQIWAPTDGFIVNGGFKIFLGE